METLTLRYFNVFGPRQDPGSPYSGVISLFVTALLAGRTPVIYGDGKQSRDFTYVENVVDGNLLALTAPGLKGQSVNLATGGSVTLLRLLKDMAKIIGAPAKAEHRPGRAGRHQAQPRGRRAREEAARLQAAPHICGRPRRDDRVVPRSFVIRGRSSPGFRRAAGCRS